MNRSAVLLVVCAATASCRGSPPAAVASVVAPQKPSVDPFAFDPELFERKHKPGSSDWMASFHEPGQTFGQYVAHGPNGVTNDRRVIVLQPIGSFTADELAVLGKLREFTSAFFQLPVRVQKPVPLPDHGFRSRGAGATAWIQYSTLTLMNDVLLRRLPSDAVCYLGITMADLYPDESWNYVFGQASFDKRVGVYSLIRYTNRFWRRPETDESKRLFLLRSFKVLAHETGHMFSMAHCTVNECLMNGSNSLDETDRSPLHLCPVCLHKLEWDLKLDVRRHYADQRDIFRRNRYDELAHWVDRRLGKLQQ